uniref:Protein kinase domain-containing protein n=1 Tax=Heterorhabditis bacteriophora TaxID=37862 RepID=A0A1I7XEI2_HETBA
MPTISTFRCLPVIERDSSSTSLTESRKVSETTLIETTLIAGERAQLFLNLESFLNADRFAKSSKLVVNQKSGAERYEQVCVLYLIDLNSENSVINSILCKTTYLSREVFGGQDATFEMDSIVCKKRKTRFEILNTIMQYRAELPLKESHDIDEPYVMLITKTRSCVCEILEEFERYQLLFPHSRAMEDECSSHKDVQFTQTVIDRVAILTSWLNTVDDIAAKIDMVCFELCSHIYDLSFPNFFCFLFYSTAFINDLLNLVHMFQLGEVFEVARLPNAEKIWPRPLHHSRQRVCLSDARPVFREYVGRSLNLKGMKKVLARVWELCETTVIKAAILLQRPPSSYAQAASRSRKMFQLSPEINTRYGEMMKFGMNSDKAIAMRLPSIVPIFLFVLGIRMELVMEWLSIRSNSTLPTGCEMDVLTLDTMIEDSRDCIEEAVRVKLYHLNVIQSICPINVKLCSPEFNDNLKDVFQKYLWYVSCWCEAIARGVELGRLFSRLEAEWAAAIKCARSIHSGLDHITTTFSSLVPHLLENLVVEFWEKSTESITEKHSLQDIRISSSDEEDISNRDHTSVFAACREYNRVIREVKDRSARIFTLLRGALLDLHDAVGYEMKESIEIIATRLIDHCLVEIGDDVGVPVSILVDTASADRAMVEELITALLEGRRPNNGHILLIPDSSFKIVAVIIQWDAFTSIICRDYWIYRRVKLAIDEEYFHKLRYLRVSNDVVYVIGNDFVLDDKMPDLFELTIPSCSSHDIVDGQLKDLAKNLVSHSGRVWQLIEHMFTAFELACDSRRMCENINSTFLQALNFAFQRSKDQLFKVWNGSGSFSVVYKAINVDKQCVIAVKKVRGDRGVLKVLEGEVDILRNLNHRNLVKYHGCEVLQDAVLILMEYCSEGTLERICREGLDMSLVRRYTNNLMHAVSYIHNNKAPEIQTFGERLEDGRYRGYGRAVDIWSIGCVVLEMITGRRPWPDMHPYQITMKAHVCQGGRPAYPAQAPIILRHFLDACFVYDPDQRKSADQLLQDPFVNIHVDSESVYTSSDLLPEIIGIP